MNTLKDKKLEQKLNELKNIKPYDSATCNDFDYIADILKEYNIDTDDMYDECELMSVNDIINKYELYIEDDKFNLDDCETITETKSQQENLKHDQEQLDVWYKILNKSVDDTFYLYAPKDATFTHMYRFDLADRVQSYLEN